jgi:hypothetical protein
VATGIEGRLDVMRSSPHENQAYEIGRRFETWLAANP